MYYALHAGVRVPFIKKIPSPGIAQLPKQKKRS
jgi:hypothetical protein